MAETKASDKTAAQNAAIIAKEQGIDYERALEISEGMRGELRSKGLKGFKKGGKVKKTGAYKLHKGEKVIPAKRVTQARRNRMRRAMVGDK